VTCGPAEKTGRLQRLRSVVQDWLVRADESEQIFIKAEKARLNQKLTFPNLSTKKSKEIKRDLEELQRVAGFAKNDQTGRYVDLIFSFGFACLGNHQQSEIFLAAATKSLSTLDPVHVHLLQGYTFRIRQALDGQQEEYLPADWLCALDEMQRGSLDERYVRYKIDRLRATSRILEPVQKVDPYASWTQRFHKDTNYLLSLDSSALQQDLFQRLDAAHNPRDLLEAGNVVSHYLSRCSLSFKSAALRILVDILKKSMPVRDLREFDKQHRDDPRNDDDYVMSDGERETFHDDYHELFELAQRASLLSMGVEIATESRDSAAMGELTESFLRLLESQHGENTFNAFTSLPGHCVRGLTALEMNEVRDRFVETAFSYLSHELGRPNVLQDDRETAKLLMLQGFALGFRRSARTEVAERILEHSFAALARPLPPDCRRHYRSELVASTIECLATYPDDSRYDRLERFLSGIVFLPDTLTTRSHFSVSELKIVEMMVLAYLGLPVQHRLSR
jgi:hypothetical protein